MKDVKIQDIRIAPVIGAVLLVDFVQRAVWLETNQGPLRLTSRKALRLDSVKQGDLASVRMGKDGSLSIRKWDRFHKVSNWPWYKG